MRVLIALGGNAMTAPDGRARPEDQIAAVERAVEPVAELVAEGEDVVLTHGNGPQVGNLLVKNELAAAVVPPVTLDWCGAQTQGTIGFMLVNALEHALAVRSIDRRVAAVVTRTRVDAHDRAFDHPTKPIGRYLPAAEAQAMIEHGQNWEDRGVRGWRRVVASPEPLEILDAPAVSALIAAGFVVVAAGGGGVPVVREADGTISGVEAVIDKDLAAAVLGHTVGADILVIATDVDHVMLGYGTDDAKAVERADVRTMRGYAAEGHFAAGSMGPKVEAACRFVEQGGHRAVITSLDRIAAAVRGEAGTEIILG
ncbi:MAG TPA: carbamate kinase [Jiangellaceae bacterium]|nr:carbamate kinase [Jiangellaceae bacterium]